MSNPFNVEFTADGGGSKWVKNVTSHTSDQIRKAWEDGEIITVKSADGGEADVDMGRVWFMRFQDGQTFEKRSRRIQGGDSQGQ